MTETIEKLDRATLLTMYRQMLQSRFFEEAVSFLFLEGKMPGTIHQYIGMEACAVGVCAALGDSDVLVSTHRSNGHAVARGTPLKAIASELYGKANGCCKGKGGSMHLSDAHRGMLPAIAIVGGSIPIVMGVALSFKLRGQNRVAVSFFGDGASNEGAFHEGLNMAALYELPALFVCENNQYGASTHISKVMKIEHIADRASAYGMRGDQADGMDVLDVYKHAKEAVDLARSGKGPTLLELKTFRLCGHSRRDPNNYMSKEEKQYWKSKDPIPAFEAVLKKARLVDERTLEETRSAVKEEVEEALRFGQESSDPRPEDTLEDLYVTMEVPE